MVEEDSITTHVRIANSTAGHMDFLANSMGVFINQLLIDGGKKPKGSFRQRRGSLRVLLQKKDIESGRLFELLNKFEYVWNFTKHGNMIGGIENPTFLKEGEVLVFTPSLLNEIQTEFTEIQGELLKINTAFIAHKISQ